MAEKIFNLQSNYGWGLSLNMTGKAPEVAKRIFNTYNDAFAYADNVDDSAVEGLTLTVVNDSDEKKNGVYFVKSVRKPSIIKKLEGDDIKNLSGHTTEDTTFTTKDDAQVWADSLTSYLDCYNNNTQRGAICKVASDYYEVRQLKCATTELIRLSTNTDTAANADEVLAELNKEISARTESEKAIYSAITSAQTELNDSIEALSSATTEAIASAKTELNDSIEALSSATTEAIASAKTELNDSIEALSSATTEAIDEVYETIDELEEKVDNHISATTSVLNTLKIKDVVNGDKVLSVAENGLLSSALSMEYDSSGKTIYLKGIDGTVISEVDATEFIKDGMLEKAEIVTSATSSKLVFTFNTDAGKENVEVPITDFINGTELGQIKLNLEAHIDSANTQHLRADERAKFDALLANYDADVLSNKFNTIESTLTSHTESIASVVAKANANETNINTISGDVKTLSGVVNTLTEANNTAHETLQSNIDAANEAISALTEANNTAHETLQSNINAIDKAYKDADTAINTRIDNLTQTVTDNKTETDEALVDLKKNKVSSISAAENSNISIVENKDDNGITYQIDFAWLEF